MGSELQSDDVRAAFAQLKKLEERISRIEEELEDVARYRGITALARGRG